MKTASDIAFTSSVKRIQEERGSRHAYARMEETRGWPTRIDPWLADFIAERRSFYFATASAEGQPYVQHRGGPAGFLKVLDERTLAFADLPGNKQFITLGNLAENPRAFIFLMDYANGDRVKIWGTARVVADDRALIDSLKPPGDREPEQAILFSVEAWDMNCSQHIPVLVPIEEVKETIHTLRAQVEELTQALADARKER